MLHLDGVPAAADRTPVVRDVRLPLWPVIGAVALVLVIVAIRIPTGRESVQDESVGDIPVPSTPLPEPQQYDLQWVPSDNTTIAVLGEGDQPVLAMRRYGPLDPIYASSVAVRGAEPPGDRVAAVVDVTPQGLVVSWDGDVATLWSPAIGQVVPLANGVTAAPTLSPNGRLLAVPIDTALFIYDLADSAPSGTVDVAATAVADVPINAVHWSPDNTLVAGAGEASWVLFDAITGSPALRGTGELMAVAGVSQRTGDPLVAVRVGDAVQVQTRDDNIHRSWPDLVAQDTPSVRAEFSPTGQYLAVQSTRPEAPGVLVLELQGQRVFRVGSRPGIGSDRAIVWSGDGRALYWLDGTQLVAWLATTRQTVLVAERDDPSEFPSRIHGIRTYDQALIPTGQLGEDPAARPPTISADGVVLTQFDGSVVIEREILPAPTDGTIVAAASAAGGGEVRWGAEFDNGQVVFLAGESWSATGGGFVTVDGAGITSLRGQIMWLADGNLYSEASFPDPLLRADRLGNGEIAAVAGLRDSLIVAFRDVGNVTQLWQIPAWSDALSTPLIENPAGVLPASPFTIAGTWLDADTVSMTRSVQQDAVAVAVVGQGAGPLTTVLFYPETDVSSICGVQLGACTGPAMTGTPATFSPDGYWLLIDRPGTNLAYSLRGRGVILFDEDTVLWQP